MCDNNVNNQRKKLFQSKSNHYGIQIIRDCMSELYSSSTYFKCSIGSNNQPISTFVMPNQDRFFHNESFLDLKTMAKQVVFNKHTGYPLLLETDSALLKIYRTFSNFLHWKHYNHTKQYFRTRYFAPCLLQQNPQFHKCRNL